MVGRARRSAPLLKRPEFAGSITREGVLADYRFIVFTELSYRTQAPRGAEGQLQKNNQHG
jgi:hypothetical protein